MNALRGSAFALLASVWIASAQEYPTKPVRVVLPFAPGGGTDVNARQLTDRLSKSWKQPVIVENLGGGGGNVAAASVVSRPEDGYTLFFTSLPRGSCGIPSVRKGISS